MTTTMSARLIDPVHYGTQAGLRFSDDHDAYKHFLQQGQRLNLTPSPYFYTEWYAWQNPDAAAFDTVLEHFASKALKRPIDPAPFIDSVAFLEANRRYATMYEALVALTEKTETSISPILADHLADLSSRQQRIHNAIRSGLVRREPTKRRRLVWVQAGPNFSTTSWFQPGGSRSWDLMCNWYSRSGIDLRHGEIHIQQPGTKSTAIHHVLRHHGDLFEPYDQVLFLDDDLTIAHADIDKVFAIAQENELDLFQPSLLPNSYCVWPDLFQKVGMVSRRTTGVEIMMPGFSRRALVKCAHLFGESVSGFGLDFAISELVSSSGWNCAVIDAVGVGHFSKIDEQSGAYYRLMRSWGVNQKLELYAVMKKLGKRPAFESIR